MNEDGNFSRAFEQLYDDNDSSALQELVYSSMAYLEQFVDFPHSGSDRDRLRFAHDAFEGDSLRLDIPDEKKNSIKAEQILDMLDSIQEPRQMKMLLTRALVLAPQGSEALQKVLTRRAASFMASKQYALATKDLERAIDNSSHPAEEADELRFRVLHKLAQCHSREKRYAQACDALRQALNHLDAMPGDVMAGKEQHKRLIEQSLQKLIAKKAQKSGKCADVSEKSGAALVLSDPHPNIADVSRDVEIRTTESQGRFAVAREAVSPGTVLASSLPAISLLNPDDPKKMFTHCLRCLKGCGPAPSPCPGCSSVVYCSDKCEKLDASVHAAECALNVYSLRQIDTGNSFRIFLTLRAIFKQPLVELTAAHGDGTGLFAMVTHSSAKTGDAMLKYLVLSVLLFRLLQRAEYVKGGDEERELDLLEIIHTLLQIQDVNTHPVLALDEEPGGGRAPGPAQVGLIKIGNAVYPQIGSYFNHSCNPNTCRINVGGLRTLLVATRSIRPGEEISDIYSVHYSETPRELRRQWLQDNFFFRCQCAACKDNLPVYEDLPSRVTNKCTLSKLQQVENAISCALRSGDYPAALNLHLRDVSILEGSVPEPHRLYISVRNSLQYVLWKTYGASRYQ